MAQDLDRLDALEREIQEIRHNATTTKYEVTETMTQRIQEILKKTRRYRSVSHFVEESISNTIKFWNQPEEMMVIANELWDDLPKETKLQIKKNAPFFYHTMEAPRRNKIESMKNQLASAKDALSVAKFSTPKNLVGVGASSLMHQSYNRFFPLKILVTALGLMIEKNKTQENKFDEARWIDYTKFSEEGFDLSLELSDKLRGIKSGQGDKRNMRISTGLPISHEASFADYSEFQGAVKEKSEKDEKSKQRFFDCFIGLKESTVLRHIDAAKDKNTILSGALNETGLVHIRNNNGKLEITLSEDGFKFFNYGNPFFDDIDIQKDEDPKSPTFGRTIGIHFNTNVDGLIEKKIFSKEETKFILEKIISRFTLEKEIVDDVLDKIKNYGEVDTKVLDKVIKNSINEWKKDNKNKKIVDDQKIGEKNNDVYRIATMGRLAEIGKVKWKIIDGKSYYSINK